MVAAIIAAKKKPHPAPTVAIEPPPSEAPTKKIFYAILIRASE
jgi:hypothetical protein